MVDTYYPTRAGALACHFTITGGNLTAYPLSGNDIQLVYYQALPPLSGANLTICLFAKSPNLYLHTCLMYAAKFVKDDFEFARAGAFVAQFLGLLNAANERPSSAIFL